MAAGRPKKYTKKSLNEAVQGYFHSISRTATVTDARGLIVKNDDGEPITYTQYLVPPSITGLCLYLGIDRSTWQNYADDEKLKSVTSDARARIEAYLEQQLLEREKGLQGIIFNLQNNFGWKQKQEVELGKETRRTMETEAMSISDKMALISAAAAERAEDTGEDGGEA